MKQYIFSTSIAGPEFSYKKGQVVTLDDKDAKKFISGGVAQPYDDHVTEVKKASAKKYTKKKTTKNANK